LDGNISNSLYTKPIADSVVRAAELYSTQGLQALYDADNARTVLGNIVQTIIATTPTGSLRRGAFAYLDKKGEQFAAKYAGTETASRVVADETGRVTAQAAEKEVGKRIAN
jgi:hypothetical protein